MAAFAVWTLLANAVVFSGGGLRLLVAAAAATGAAALSVALARRRGGRLASARSEVAPHPIEPDRTPSPRARVAVLCASALCVAAFAWTGEVVVYWAGALALCLALAFRELRNPAIREPPVSSPGARRLVLALAISCAAFPLFVHRPDADDAFYVNLAVAAVDHPEAPLITWDTLHGIPGVRNAVPVYKVQSIELFEAAVAYLTPLRVLDVTHVVLPPLVAFLIPLALARLFRMVLPRRWPWAVAATVAVLLCIGAPHRSYGNFSFVRLHQGKGILLSLALPLVMATALEFSLAPTLARWLRLAAVQIAAMGASATGLWVAPAVSGFALASAAAPRSRSLRTLIVGLSASTYVLLLALCVRGGAASASALSPLRWLQETNARHALEYVLGTGPVTFVALFAVAGSWALAPGALWRRFGVAFTLGFLVFLWNPFAAHWVGTHVTGPPTYWRVFWALPIPVLLAVMLTAPLELSKLRRSRWVLCGALATALLAFAPAAHTWSRVNLAHFGAPGWKLPKEARRAAQALTRAAPQGTLVLAPEGVARWLPTLHHHPTPLVVREDYLEVLRSRVGEQEIERRKRLARAVAGWGRATVSGQLLARAVEEYPLQAVCLASRALGSIPLRRALESSGLLPFDSAPGYEIWARP